MESYCEVTVLFSSLLQLTVWSFTALVSQHTADRRRMILCCWIPSLTACIQPTVSLCLISELVCLFLVYGFGVEAMLLAMGTRLSLCFCFMKLFEGSFVQLHLFIPLHSTGWIPAGVILIILDQLFQRMEGDLAMTRYLYPVILQENGRRRKLTGYMDSGNLLQYRGIPVIFIQEALQERTEKVTVATVNGNSEIRIIPGRVKLAGKWKRVWIGQDAGMQDCGFDVLLNVTLFKEEKE